MQQTPAGSSRFLESGHTLVNRYEIQREVGRGGYSVVYLARDLDLDTDVAVKLLVPPPALAALARERMRREAIAARGLAHPNIVSLHDFAEDGPWSFLVMEFVEGPDLRERVDTEGPLSAADVVLMGCEIGSALDAAHGQGVLHRDVKPQNVLIDEDGSARLTDFGSARIESQATVTATGGVVGTVAYAAPEEISGQRADSRSDLFSLGLTLYFALVGRLPEGPSPHLPPARVEGGHRPREARPEVPLWLDEVIACATSAAPGHRFPTAGSMRDALLAGREAVDLPSLLYRVQEVGCPLCGTVDDLEIGVCPGCADGATRADALIIVSAPDQHKDRADLADRLSNRLGHAVRRADLRDVLSGVRPLASVPADSESSVISALREQSIPVTVEPVGTAWRRIPVSFLATVLAVIVAGLAAGQLAAPSMMVATPLFGALLLSLAVRRIRTPVLRGSGQTRNRLPEAAERSVRQALATARPGPARSLLKDVVRMAAGVYEQDAAAPSPGSLGEPLEGLVVKSCDLAVDLGHLDESLAILEARDRDGSGAVPDDRKLESLSRARQARDGLTQQLLAAVAALGRTRIAIASGESAAAGLSAFSSELEMSATAYADARREVEALAG